MTVEELINQLKQFPSDLRIYTDDPNDSLGELGGLFLIKSSRDEYDGHLYMHFNFKEDE